MVQLDFEVEEMSRELARGSHQGGLSVMVTCPLCDASIDVDEDELDEGDSLICEECGATLNVTGVSPLELSSDDEEDFEGEEDDDDEDDDDYDDDDDDDDDFDDDDEEVEDDDEE